MPWSCGFPHGTCSQISGFSAPLASEPAELVAEAGGLLVVLGIHGHFELVLQALHRADRLVTLDLLAPGEQDAQLLALVGLVRLLVVGEELADALDAGVDLLQGRAVLAPVQRLKRQAPERASS